MAPYIGVAKNIGQICAERPNFFLGLGRLGGVSRVGILKMFRGVQSNFFNSQGEDNFSGQGGGVQSRTMKAKGGHPPSPSPPMDTYEFLQLSRQMCRYIQKFNS